MSHPMTIYAQFWDENGVAFGNFTRGAVATDPTTGTKYFSSGSAEIRFKKSGNQVPLFAVGAPSLKMDCGGMSLNGMFGSLINLEQLGNQLKDAGASLAWGVMIGLAYSLPSLKQVFDEINKWSNFLNSILQRACSFGKMIGTPIGQRIRGDIENALSPSDSGKVNVDNALNTDNSIADNWFKSLNEGKLTPQDVKNGADTLIRDILLESQKGILSSYMTSLYATNKELGEPFSMDFKGTNIAIKHYDLKDLMDSHGFTATSAVSVFVIQQLLESDIGISKDSHNLLLKISDESSSKAEEIGTIIKELTEKPDIRFSEFTSGEHSTYEQISQFLKTGKYDENLELLNTPSFLFVTKRLADGSLEKIVLLTSLNNAANQNYKNIFSDFKGLERASAVAFKQIADNIIKGLRGESIEQSIEPKAPIMNRDFYTFIKEYVVAKGAKGYTSSTITLSSNTESSHITIKADQILTNIVNDFVSWNSYLIIDDIIRSVEHLFYTNARIHFNRANKTPKNDSTPIVEYAESTENTYGDERLKVLENLRDNFKAMRSGTQEKIKEIKDDAWLKDEIRKLRKQGKRKGSENAKN
ncbi:MAG: conjugal transfer protein TraH [Halarcobacter sp.]